MNLNLEAVQSKLHKYLFPVEERLVYFQDAEGNPDPTRGYKAIVRSDKDKLISIQNSSYILVPNREVIMPVMEQLNNLDTKWNLDRSHSFIKDNRMRLQITFPDLTFNDGSSDVALSLFLHNSYDGSEGVRMFWGAIRGICTNGMVFGKVLAKFYAKHTKNIQIKSMHDQVHATYDSIPIIKERIDILRRLEVPKEYVEKTVKKEFGVKVAEYVKNQPNPMHMYALYNMITYYISHYVKHHMMASYQMKASKLFEL